MSVLSRLPERSMCGFSRLVARDVTQPLWPSSVPRITNCSPMLGGCRTRNEEGLVWLHFSNPYAVGVVLARCSFKIAGEKLRQVICGPKFKREIYLSVYMH